MNEKIQKVLANLGIGSRREIERWIREGRIRINQQLAKLGDRIDLTAKILIDGKPVLLVPAIDVQRRALIYHKPEGEICARSDPEGRPTVFEHLPRLRGQRWIMIGRLDINTLGLLVFTNDGELAHRLSHPSYEIEREYAVRVLGKVDEKILDRLRKGVKLEDGMAAFTRIEERGGSGANHWYHVVLKEGRNREVRRLWESQGVNVSRLLRVRFGNVTLPEDLSRGQHRELKADEMEKLARLVGLDNLWGFEHEKGKKNSTKKT
ncbi:MAG: pseudouridine synthase [Pseudomonadota bacterium]|jgi:23S rRNA pseudouridine2605 synthase